MTRFEILKLAIALASLLVASIGLLLKLFTSLVKFFDERYRRK